MEKSNTGFFFLILLDLLTFIYIAKALLFSVIIILHYLFTGRTLQFFLVSMIYGKKLSLIRSKPVIYFFWAHISSYIIIKPLYYIITLYYKNGSQDRSGSLALEPDERSSNLELALCPLLLDQISPSDSELNLGKHFSSALAYTMITRAFRQRTAPELVLLKVWICRPIYKAVFSVDLAQVFLGVILQHVLLLFIRE